MQTTVLRDHDKYCLLAACLRSHDRQARAPHQLRDTVGPTHVANAYQIACTGDAADYKWIAEPGEDYDNQIQPSFATITGMYLDDTDPLSSLDALTLLFSDNWFDSNFGNNERFLLITSALELVFINALIDKPARARRPRSSWLATATSPAPRRQWLPRHAQGLVEARQDAPGVVPEGLHRRLNAGGRTRSRTRRPPHGHVR
jgi:hypothetical protein